jgi:PHP family Zn ribbon phosphoesterase
VTSTHLVASALEITDAFGVEEATTLVLESTTDALCQLTPAHAVTIWTVLLAWKTKIKDVCGARMEELELAATMQTVWLLTIATNIAKLNHKDLAILATK